jgi:hypothetical protein
LATLVLDELQEIERPESVLPPASFVTAANWRVAPRIRLALAGVTVTVATGTGAGAVTVTSVVPDMPSLVAVIVAVPAASAVTRPLALTVATPLLELDQVIVRPLSVVPEASLVTATSCRVRPAVMLGLCGVTVTVATGGAFTVRLADAEIPSLVAVMLTWPGATAVT